MELDQSHLQFVFNVIAITGLTSLALIWSILKRDKERLSSSQPAPPAAPEQPAIRPNEVAVIANQDIRLYVSGRMQDWIKIQAASTKAQGVVSR